MADSKPTPLARVRVAEFDEACQECGSARHEIIKSFPGAADEPPHAGGECCFDCGHFFNHLNEGQ